MPVEARAAAQPSPFWFQGQSCETCGIRMHLPCVAKYFQSAPEPRCPHCNDYWPHEIPGSRPSGALGPGGHPGPGSPQVRAPPVWVCPRVPGPPGEAAPAVSRRLCWHTPAGALRTQRKPPGSGGP